jgi:tetratricopeptide (TPR) repeat protein
VPNPLPEHRWEKVEALFAAAVELPPSGREPFLDSMCGSDFELRDEVLSLLRYECEDAPEIVTAINASAASLMVDDSSAGRTLGSYQIDREIGRGGMAVVYEGVRADGQFHKRVAIKLIKRGMDSGAVIERLRRERHILAGLEHPYIARLLDGGTTAQGHPYLVMEFIDGLQVDRFCQEHRLTVRQRCELVVKVCEAVAYAHRKLIVHRDLKPANILIAADGTPKLLDFGLAKILDADIDGSLTVNAPAARPLTPDYASPEQILGLELTTATDVYSLGVILYELLAGARPFKIQSGSAEEWKRAVCETDLPRPSAVAGRFGKRLEGDLDNIVMKAMHKNPERRYVSVDELASDLKNYLELRPVQARPDSVGYRMMKFAHRRRLPLLATAVAITGLIVGTSVAVTQAREADRARRTAEMRAQEANRARQAAESEHTRAERERDTAVTERQRAEERLAEMVGMSDRSLTGAYAQLERLPGTVPARREMIRTTLDYLERLSKDARDNPRLQVALAKAYLGMGDLLFDPNGEIAAALKSFRAGEAVVNRGAASDPERLLVWMQLEIKIAEMLGRQNKGAGVPVLLNAINVTSKLPESLFASKEALRTRATLSLWMARVSPPDFDRARKYAQLYLAQTEALRQNNPADPDLLYDVSVAQVAVGWVDRNVNDLESAASYYSRAVQIREQLAREHPDDKVYHSALMFSYQHYAGVESELGNLEVARANFRKAQPMVEEEVAADPKDSQAAARYAMFLLRMASLDTPPDGLAESLAMLRRSAALFERLPELRSYYLLDIARDYDFIGRRLEAMGNSNEALDAYQRSGTMAAQYLAANPNNRDAILQTFDAERGVIRVLTMTRKQTEALDRAQRLIQKELAMVREPSLDAALAQAYFTLANVHQAFGDLQAAYAAAQEAVRRATPLATGKRWDPNAKLLVQAQTLAAECAPRPAAP